MGSISRVWAAIAIGMLWCVDVEAQPAWEVDVHGGSLTGSNPEGGTFALPPPGPLVPPNQNRPVSSWFFGDGAFQLNQFIGVRQSGILVALDGTLQSRMARRETGGALGVRLSRRLTRRIAAELSVDYARGPLAFSSDATSAIEAARASFITALNGLLAGPLVASRQANAIAEIADTEGTQLLTTGAVRVDLLIDRRWAPYVVGGVGAISIHGDAPAAVLTGTYGAVLAVPLNLPIPPPTFTQTDAITLTSTVDAGAVWVLGGGLRVSVSDRWAIRIDVRDHMHGDTMHTRVSASPQPPPATFGTYIIGALNNPPVVISSSPLTPSTLSVPLDDFVTFSGEGIVHQVGVTTGLSWRF